MSDTNNQLDLRRFVRSAKQLRWIFIASPVVFIVLATIYCLMRQPQFEIKSTILIEDPSDDTPTVAGGLGAMMKTFSVGGFGASSVDNEILLVNSHDVLMHVAKALELNRTYTEKNGLKKRMLFSDSPIHVSGAKEMMDTLSHGMKMKVKINNETADISVTKGIFGHKLAECKGVKLPASVETPYGTLRVEPTKNYNGRKQTIDVSIGSYADAADFLEKDIMVDKADKLSDAISFEMLYPNKERGMAILNAIMNEYNAKRLNRKQETAATELEFLDGRIADVFDQLSETEEKIKAYKIKNKTVSIEAEAPLVVENMLAVQTEMIKSQAEIQYLNGVLSALNDSNRTEELLPVFDNEAYPMIKDYNELLMEKRTLLQSANNSNPIIVSMTENLNEMRKSVTDNVESMIRATKAILSNQAALAGKANSKLNSMPAMERDFILMERDRMQKSTLYLYLVDKRESAMLQLYSQSQLGFVIDEAYSASKPSKKKPLMVYAACLLSGLLLPTFAAAIKTLMSKKIEDPIDLAFCGLEQNTIALTNESTNSINRLRDKLIKDGIPERIYVGGEERERLADLIEKSLTSIDIPILRIEPSNNDELRSKRFNSRIEEISKGYNPTIITIPDNNNIIEVAPLAGKMSPIVLAVKPDSVLRNSIRALAAETGVNDLYIAIA